MVVGIRRHRVPRNVAVSEPFKLRRRALKARFAMLLALPLVTIGYALSIGDGFAQSRCLTDAEIEQVVGDQIRSGALLVDTKALPDIPLCSRLTIAQTIQRLREEAFPREAAQEEDEQQALIARERGQRRATSVRAPARRAPVIQRARSTEPRQPAQPAVPSRKVRSKTGTASPR